MQKRPRIEIEKTSFDWAGEIAGWLLLVALWALVLMNYSSLPEIIPTHFDGAGIADGFGKKSNLILLSAITTLLFLGLTALTKYPHVFNFPIEITPENAKYQYTQATRMIRYIKLAIMAIFGTIAWRTIQIAKGHSEALGAWFLPLALGLIFVPLIFYLLRVNKQTGRTEHQEQ